MSKKSLKLGVTYFVTIICSMGLIGGACYYALNSYLNSDSGQSSITPDTEIQPAGTDDEYIPQEGFGQTALAVYETEQRESAVCFMLARLVPSDSKIVLVPLQSDICTTVDGKSNTLYEFYRLGGIKDAVRAVETATNIRVDNYITFDTDSFALFSNLMGNVEYNVPYNLAYDNAATGETTAIREGRTMLDSVTLRKILTYPEYKGGEEARARVTGEIAVLLINSGAKGMLKDNLDTVYNDIVNSSAATDFDKYDYDDLRPALLYVFNENSSPAQLVIPSGTYNENNCYVLDDTFIQALPRWMDME